MRRIRTRRCSRSSATTWRAASAPRSPAGPAETPFQVSDTRIVIDPPHPMTEVAPATVTTHMPRFASISPDGSRVVFESLGRLYLRDVAGGGAPRPLTAPDGDFQLFPSW